MMKSNDKPRAVKIEIRAAQLAADWQQHAETRREYAGYRAHADDRDIPPGGESGWLMRQIVYHADNSRVAVPIVVGPEPEQGVELEAEPCPRQECAEGCVQRWGGCLETVEPE
jgi:hypothetical protein